MYDKDLICNDFLGKAMLSIDKLKEISYKVSLYITVYKFHYYVFKEYYYCL
jgi:hypothetical protein